jgi:ElaB/YqjD/DUF883 family membrane-anchored ribosome-binding protein
MSRERESMRGPGDRATNAESPQDRGSTMVNEDDPGMTGRAQEMASNAGQKAQDTADAGISRAAGGLEKAADQMRERVQGDDGTTAQIGTKVADSLERTAGYLREHDSDQIWEDVEAFVKEHPMQAAAGAALAGFVAARMLR